MSPKRMNEEQEFLKTFENRYFEVTSHCPFVRSKHAKFSFHHLFKAVVHLVGIVSIPRL